MTIETGLKEGHTNLNLQNLWMYACIQELLDNAEVIAEKEGRTTLVVDTERWELYLAKRRVEIDALKKRLDSSTKV